MTEYLIRRLLQSILVLFLVSVAAFGLMHAAPGGGNPNDDFPGTFA